MSADIVSKVERSRMMSRIKNKNTKPEIIVRQYLHNLGFRFRLHQSELPGTPDMVLRKYKVVIFVNGCYWHRHENCKLAYTPKSNSKFWLDKFNQNTMRDKKNYAALRAKGWQVLVVWECEIYDLQFLTELANKIRNATFLMQADQK